LWRILPDRAADVDVAATANAVMATAKGAADVATMRTANAAEEAIRTDNAVAEDMEVATAATARTKGSRSCDDLFFCRIQQYRLLSKERQ